MKSLPPIERVKELLSYDPETGIFKWRVRVSNRALVGSVAGATCRGYAQIQLDGEIYRSHRLAWYVVHGSPPAKQIDHVNGNRSDNRIVNLREASPSENNCNQQIRSDNRSGVKGVGIDKRDGKFYGRAKKQGIRCSTSGFATAEEAGASLMMLREDMHGEFAHHGNPTKHQVCYLR